MKTVKSILLFCCMAMSHAAFCQNNDTTSNRFILTIKKNRTKTLYANVAGIVTGNIKKDSLLKAGKVKMVDLQKRYKNMKIVSFEMRLERADSATKWRIVKKSTVYSLYYGNEFTDEMKQVIKWSRTGDRIEIYVTGVYFNEMNMRGVAGIGYGGRVCLTLL